MYSSDLTYFYPSVMFNYSQHNFPSVVLCLSHQLYFRQSFATHILRTWVQSLVRFLTDCIFYRLYSNLRFLFTYNPFWLTSKFFENIHYLNNLTLHFWKPNLTCWHLLTMSFKICKSTQFPSMALYYTTDCISETTLQLCIL